jgi:hypothetical protein
MRGGEAYDLQARSLVVLRLPKHAEGENGNGEVRSMARRVPRSTAIVNGSTL